MKLHIYICLALLSSGDVAYATAAVGGGFPTILDVSTQRRRDDESDITGSIHNVPEVNSLQSIFDNACVSYVGAVAQNRKADSELDKWKGLCSKNPNTESCKNTIQMIHMINSEFKPGLDCKGPSA